MKQMMKSYILILLLPLLTTSVWAGVNELRISDIQAEAGQQVKLSIELVCDQSIIAFGAYMVLPEGVSLEGMAITDRWNSKGALVQYKMYSEGLYKIVGVDMKNAPIPGNVGSIVDVTLNIDKDMAAGVYEIRLEQIELAPKRLPDGTQLGNLQPEDYIAIQTVGKASLEIKGRGDDNPKKPKQKIDFTHVVKKQPQREGETVAGVFNDNYLMINLQDVFDLYTITISNSLGEVVYTKQVKTDNVLVLNIDISDLPYSDYTVTMENDEYIFTGHFFCSPPYDYDGDGVLTLNDVTTLVNIYLTDEDGWVTVSDVTALLEIYLNKDKE